MSGMAFSWCVRGSGAGRVRVRVRVRFVALGSLYGMHYCGTGDLSFHEDCESCVANIHSILTFTLARARWGVQYLPLRPPFPPWLSSRDLRYATHSTIHAWLTSTVKVRYSICKAEGSKGMGASETIDDREGCRRRV